MQDLFEMADKKFQCQKSYSISDSTKFMKAVKVNEGSGAIDETFH